MSTHPKKTDTSPAVPTLDTAQVLKLLDQVSDALSLTSPMLTASQRRAATRSRKGMEKVISTLASLSAEHGVSVPKQPTSDMTAAVDLVTQLETVQQKLVGITTIVGKNIESGRSTSWGTATTLYGMLKKAGHRDEQLRSQLAPVSEFFAYRHKATATTSSKSAGTSTAATAGTSDTANAAVVSPTVATPATPQAPSVSSESASTSAQPAPSNVVVTHTP